MADRELKGEGRRAISIFGSTGSIGRNTLDLLERDPAAYRVEVLTANHNAAQLAEQARRVGARMAVVADPDRYGDLRAALSGSGVEAAAGPDAVAEAAERPVDWVMSAIVGAAGLAPTLRAVRSGAVVALANKETLVCAGDIVMAEVARCGATLLPVDSEHNAIFQVFDFARPQRVEKIILTASGGPFRDKDMGFMEAATPDQAVAHPNWSMGAKISVDSATMMNKGLEMIEASHLFPVSESAIEVIVHPQSVIHSMVAYQDGSVLAQLGSPDMRTPIAYSLAWPDRMPAPVEKLDLARIARLTFEAPDPVRFPALRLAREALQGGGAIPTVLNASNEVAVAGFLDRRIGFLDIARVVEDTMEAAPGGTITTLDEILEMDAWARRRAAERMTAAAAQ